MAIRVTKESSSSGKEFHVAQEDFSPGPSNADIVSRLVKAWKSDTTAYQTTVHRIDSLSNDSL